MSRKATPILLAIAVVLGLAALLSERSRAPERSRPKPQGERVLEIDRADVRQIRIKRDYWNSLTLARDPDGTWKLVEPANEPASAQAVSDLLNTLEFLPAVSTINLPSDDSERYREYGLWEPAMTVTVTVEDQVYTLLLGSETPDGKGVYCALSGMRKVYITSPEAVKSLSADLAAYRQQAASAPAATPSVTPGPPPSSP